MSINIKRCAECDKIFAHEITGAASILCRFCIVDCESSFPAVRRFIDRNPFSTIEQISEGCGVSSPLIKGLILEGRFDGGKVEGIDEMLTAQRKHQALSMIHQQDKQAQVRAQTPRPSSSPGSGGSNKSYGLGRN